LYCADQAGATIWAIPHLGDQGWDFGRATYLLHAPGVTALAVDKFGQLYLARAEHTVHGPDNSAATRPDGIDVVTPGFGGLSISGKPRTIAENMGINPQSSPMIVVGDNLLFVADFYDRGGKDPVWLGQGIKSVPLSGGAAKIFVDPVRFGGQQLLGALALVDPLTLPPMPIPQPQPIPGGPTQSVPASRP